LVGRPKRAKKILALMRQSNYREPITDHEDQPDQYRTAGLYNPVSLNPAAHILFNRTFGAPSK
jgi:hypothetical protein